MKHSLTCSPYLLVALTFSIVGALWSSASAAESVTIASSRLVTIGKKIFMDENLSEPRGTACISCHIPATGFANNHRSPIGVPLGSQSSAFGLRNAMANAYSAFVPPFQFRVVDGDTDPVGGHFWDGRADTLAIQAMAPFLSPREMNNPSAEALIKKVAASEYADLIRAEFGSGVFDNADQALKNVATAIAAFEASNERQPFSSKYDQFTRGEVTLSAQETRGMQLFMDTTRGNCVTCHVMNPASQKPEDNLFADFAYYANGIPRNQEIPQNADPNFFDLGLCGPLRQRPALTDNVPAGVSIEQFCGRFRMVSLRNVALRQRFMHNGFFKNLRDVIDFYSTRNSDPQRWYGPTGIPDDLPVAYLGNINNDHAPFTRPKSAGPLFTSAETDDLLAFLSTLNDRIIEALSP